MRVLKSRDGPLDETETSGRAITCEDLVTHRSGLTTRTFIKLRLLRPERPAIMITSELTDGQRGQFRLLGHRLFAVGRDFGFRVRVFWGPMQPT